MAAGVCGNGCCHTTPPLEQPLAAIMGNHPYASIPNYMGLASVLKYTFVPLPNHSYIIALQ